jgi:hypothetical protein
MELTIQQGDLAYAVAKAIASVPTKSPMPLLSCLLLEADKGTLTVTGTDLEVTTAVTVPCAVSKPGKAAVPGRHFSDVVRKIPRGELKLALAGDQVELRYGGGKGWAKFPTQDPADFPRVPDLKAESRMTIEGPSLARLVSIRLATRSTDAARPQPGVLMHGSDNQMILVATDGQRLRASQQEKARVRGSAEGRRDRSRTRARRGPAGSPRRPSAPVEIEIAGPRNQAGFSARVGDYQWVQVSVRLLQGTVSQLRAGDSRGATRARSWSRAPMLAQRRWTSWPRTRTT